MPYLGYLLAQAVKAGQTVTSALTSAASYVTRVGGSVVELSAGAEALKSPSAGSGLFNGSSDYVLLKSNGNNTSFDTQEYTIAAWANAKVSGDNVIWSFDHTSHTQPYYAQQFRLLGGGNIYLGWNDGTSVQSIQSPSSYYSVGEWFHVVATFKSGSQKIYKNGSEVASGTSSHTISYYDQEVVIGVSPNFGGDFEGNLANVAFWSRVLTPEEVRSVMMKSYADLSASETKGLVSWYALDDISGTTVPDSHGNFNGTAY